MQRLILICLIVSNGMLSHAQDSQVVNLPTATVLTDRSLFSSPGYTEQFDTDSLLLAKNQSLAALLRQNTGAFIRSYGANGVALASLRGGSSQQTEAWWNGIRATAPNLGLMDFSLISLNRGDRVAVSYGGSTLARGSGALGGMVSVDKKWDSIDSFNVLLSSDIESFGNRRFNGNVNFANGRLSSSSSFFLVRNKNQFPFVNTGIIGQPIDTMDFAAFNSTGFQQHFNYCLTDNWKLSTGLLHSVTGRELPGSMANLMSGSRLNDDYTLGYLKANYGTDKNRLLLNFGYSGGNNVFITSGIDQEGRHLFQSFQFHANWEHLDFENGITYFLRYDQFTDVVSSSNIDEDPLSQQRSGLSGGLSYQWKKWRFNTVLREELVDFKTNPVSGELALIHKTGKSGMLHLNLSRNFRYPSMNDRYWSPGGNTDLKPELAIGGELGYSVSHQREKTWYSFQTNGFYQRIDDWIQWRPGPSFWYPENVKEVSQVGVQLSLESKHQFGGFRLYNTLRYTGLKATNTDLYYQNDELIGKELIFIPNHKAYWGLRLLYELYFVQLDQRYNGSYYISSNNSETMPAFYLMDFSAGTQDLDMGLIALQLSGGLQNVFDTRYQVLPQRPEMGRSLFIKIQVQWQ